MLDQLFGIEAQLDQEKEALSERLYHIVGTVEDKKQRNALLKLKRDLFNLRTVDPAFLASIRASLPAPAATAVERFYQRITARAHVLRELESTYRTEAQAARKQFQGLLTDHDFQKGLLISSRSLFNAQRRYLNAGFVEPTSKNEKIERGLLRYFSRMTMKATPFGTFCAIIPGTFSTPTTQGDAEKLFAFDQDPRTKQSFIRLNKSLSGVLLDHLKTRPSIRAQLHVELNPTLRAERDVLVFLSAVEGRETFQRLSQNAVLHLISTTMQQQGHLPLGYLIEALTTHPKLDASEQDATQYLDKLIEIGFLRFRTGIREQEVDWDLLLREQLAQIDDEHAQEAARLLKALRQQVAAYEHATIEERAVQLQEMHARIQAAFDQMGIPSQATAGLPFYEDATSPSQARLFRSAKLTRALNDLQDFMRQIYALAWPRAEQASMRHFFDTYYDTGQAAPVPLLQFYEDYYREHFKRHLEKQQEAQTVGDGQDDDGYDIANPFDLDLIHRMKDARERLTARIVARWNANPEAETIALTEDDLQAALEAIVPASPPCWSVSVFAQLVLQTDTEDTPRLIIPNGGGMAGYGKFFSRFLYLFPESIQQHLQEANASLTQQCLAEICGDANFNANLHPPLLPWEISYPTGESGIADEQLLSSDLYVVPDAENPHTLGLYHSATGNRVLPVDLGFLNPRMRPPLYQMLSRFTPFATVSMALPETPDEAQAHPPEEATEQNDTKAEPPLEILYRPRITYNDTLVLSRKRWYVPPALFPTRKSGETASDYFVRVNRWRHHHRLPREVYVRIFPLPPSSTNNTTQAQQPDDDAPRAPEEEATPRDTQFQNGHPAGQAPPQNEQANNQDTPTHHTRASRDWRKPQYIDFSNPLLVNLFGKMTVNLKQFSAYLEERYPAGEALLRYKEDAYATELILQLNFPEEATRPLEVEEAIHAAC